MAANILCIDKFVVERLVEFFPEFLISLQDPADHFRERDSGRVFPGRRKPIRSDHRYLTGRTLLRQPSPLHKCKGSITPLFLLSKANPPAAGLRFGAACGRCPCGGTGVCGSRKARLPRKAGRFGRSLANSFTAFSRRIEEYCWSIRVVPFHEFANIVKGECRGKPKSYF